MVNIRPLTLGDDFSRVAELIYLTDPYIYPTWFENIDIAKKVLPEIMMKDTVYNFKNIIVAEFENQIVGIVVFLENFPMNNYDEILSVYHECNILNTKKLQHVNQFYLEKLKDDIFGKNLVCVSVLEKYRRKGIATKLLQSLKEPKQSLAVVKNNYIAQTLYKKMGFKIIYEYLGYLDVPCFEMRKEDKNGSSK